jgi:hypothetical protein
LTLTLDMVSPEVAASFARRLRSFLALPIVGGDEGEEGAVFERGGGLENFVPLKICVVCGKSVCTPIF